MMTERLIKPMSIEELQDFSGQLREDALRRFKKHKVLQKASNTSEMEHKLSVSFDFIFYTKTSYLITKLP